MAVAGVKLFGAEVQGPLQAAQALLYAPSNGLGADLVHVAEAFRICAPTSPDFPKAFADYRAALAPGDAFARPLLTAHWALVDAIRDTPAATWESIVTHVETTAPWLASAGWLVTSHDPVRGVGRWTSVRDDKVSTLLQAFDVASEAVRAFGFGSSWANSRSMSFGPAELLSSELRAESLNIATRYNERLYGAYPCLEYLRRGKAAVLAGDVGLALYEVALGTITGHQ